MAILVFQVIVADQTGQMTLCLPSRSIRKMIDKLLVNEYPGADEKTRNDDDSDSGNVSGGRKGRREGDRDLAEDDQPIVVQFTAEAITSAERRNLRVGDVILSELSIESPVDLVVGDRVVAKGMLALSTASAPWKFWSRPVPRSGSAKDPSKCSAAVRAPASVISN